MRAGHFSLILTFVWVFSIINCCQAQPPGLEINRPKKKFESQLIDTVSSCPPSYGAMAVHWHDNVSASFSRDGSFILVSSFADHKTVRIDTKTLQKTEVSSSLRNKFVCMHSITGEIFAWRFRETVTDAELKDALVDEKSNSIMGSKETQFAAILKQGFDLVNYRSVDDFKANKVNWTIPNAEHAMFHPGHSGLGEYSAGFGWLHHGTRFCWLPKYQVYATSSYEGRNERELLFIDTKGKIVGRFKFGAIMGIDIGESGIEVFQRTGKRLPFFVQRSIINEKLTEVTKTDKLYRMPAEWIHAYPFLPYGTKALRYVDHRPGDVIKFYTELMNDARFWTYQDYPDLQEQFQGANEYLTPEHYKSLFQFFGRYPSFGKFSSMEDPLIPEITSTSKIINGLTYRNNLVMDHAGGLLPLPYPMVVVDAHFDKERQMMIGFSGGSNGVDAEFHLIKLVSGPDQNN